jgi:hypothetical protein
LLDAENGNHDAAVWFGAIVLHGTAGKPGKLEARRSVEDVRRVIEAGTRTIIDWPAAFQHELAAKRRPPPEGGAVVQLVSDAFPGLDRALERAPEAWRQRIAEALDVFVRDEGDAGRPLIGKNWFIATKVPTLHQRARALHVSFCRLRRALDNDPDGLRCCRVTRAGRLRAVLSDSEMVILEARLHDAIGMKTAARELGVKVDRVTELVRSGHLTRAPNGRLSRANVARFQEALLLEVPIMNPDAAGFMSIVEAFKRWVPVARTGEFFDMAREGGLECRRTAAHLDGLRSLRFGSSEVVNWARRSKSSRRA